MLCTGSANKEYLLYGLVDDHLSRGSFNGRPRPELDKDFLSSIRQCSAAALMKEVLQHFAAYMLQVAPVKSAFSMDQQTTVSLAEA